MTSFLKIYYNKKTTHKSMFKIFFIFIMFFTSISNIFASTQGKTVSIIILDKIYDQRFSYDIGLKKKFAFKNMKLIFYNCWQNGDNYYANLEATESYKFEYGKKIYSFDNEKIYNDILSSEKPTEYPFFHDRYAILLNKCS